MEDFEFCYVGHRVVHGGETFKTAAMMTDENIDKLEKISSLAPLHNPVQTQVIQMCKERYPELRHGAVFDTSFHSSMPEHSYMYPLPLDWFTTYNIRR